MSFEWRRLWSSRELALRKDLEERSVVVAAELAELKDNGPCAVGRRIVCSATSAQIRKLTIPQKGYSSEGGVRLPKRSEGSHISALKPRKPRSLSQLALRLALGWDSMAHVACPRRPQDEHFP